MRLAALYVDCRTRKAAPASASLAVSCRKIAMKPGTKRKVKMIRRCFASFRACVQGDPSREEAHINQDLSAFAMPLLESDLQDSVMDIDTSDSGRPRSSSGSQGGLKQFFGSKGRQRNKSGDTGLDPSKGGGSSNNGSSPAAAGAGSASSKVKSFFDNFRPRSKSDVSGLTKPGKKHRDGMAALAMDRSMDESVLPSAGPVSGTQFVPPGFKPPTDPLSPMSQILEGQMLGLPGHESERVRHKSHGAMVGYDNFMTKFRTRSNSDSRTKGAPRRPLLSQVEKSMSPPGSPRVYDKPFSPLRAGSGEPRSAPPLSSLRASFSDHTHAIIYKSDLMRVSLQREHVLTIYRLMSKIGHRSGSLLSMESDNDRMEIEDLDENTEQVYSKFMRAHKCYDLIPTSAKLVIFDTQLNVKKAFFALVYNGVRAAPLWDSQKQDYVGMLTITDFISILKMYYKSPDARLDELEDHKIATWREVLKTEHKPFVYIEPDASLFEAVRMLVDNRVHRLPVVDAATGNAIYILTHKRILRFLHIYINDLPKPGFMCMTLKELKIGTYENVITASKNMPLIQALNLFVDHRISALPVLNDEGQVCDIYAKFDVINLAAEKTYNNLDISIEQALRHRVNGEEGVAQCFDTDTLQDVMETIVKAEVHRLVIVDENRHVKGIVSLSDLLHYIIVKPMELGLENVTLTEASTSRSPSSAPVTMMPIPMQTSEANS